MKTQPHIKPNEPKIPVSTRALVARLRRSLGKEGLLLKKSRTPVAAQECGEWFVITDQGHFHENDIDVEQYARARDLLRPYEIAQG